MAATKTATTDNLDPGLLLRLFGHRTYLLGLLCQIFGFFFALAARRDLPLFLVQSAVTAGLCVTALLGVVILKWRLPRAEIALLILVVLGIGALAASAEPSKGEQLGIRGIITLIVALARDRGRQHLRRPHQGRARLGGARLDRRASASPPPRSPPARWPAPTAIAEFVLNPLLYLVIAHSLTGQLLLGLAMQRGSTNAAVAGMDAAGAVPAAVIGLRPARRPDAPRPGVARGDRLRGHPRRRHRPHAIRRAATRAGRRARSTPVPPPLRLRPRPAPHPARGVVECATIGRLASARTHPTIALQRPLAQTAASRPTDTPPSTGIRSDQRARRGQRPCDGQCQRARRDQRARQRACRREWARRGDGAHRRAGQRPGRRRPLTSAVQACALDDFVDGVLRAV